MNNKSLLIQRVYKLELTQRATLVAFYLINRANHESTCFPGVKTIAKECHMSTRTVQRALNDLEEAGFLKRESRFHEMGGQRSNLYYLQIDEMDGLEDGETIEAVDNDLKKLGALGGDKDNACAYNTKVNYLESVENVDFLIYSRDNTANPYLSRGQCQRDGP